MDVVKATVKGQILIPVSLRRKYQIEKGTAPISLPKTQEQNPINRS